MTVAALIVAAGRGHRAGGGLPKQYRKVAGRVVLARTVAAFAAHPKIDRIAVVIHPDDASLAREALGDETTALFAFGAATRQGSVRNGLEALVPSSPTFVLIHDAARPFVCAAVIERVISALTPGTGTMPGLPVTDTIRKVDGDGQCASVVPRDGLWRAQTPQGFCYSSILDAHRLAAGSDLTDDVAVAQMAGIHVACVEGDPRNVKLTTPADFAEAEAAIRHDEHTRHPALPSLVVRTGLGVDVHKFGPGDDVCLCGVVIPHDRALVGHSDADVGLHALTDALLGAVGAGDIGDHFPPSDPRWRGAPSHLFLSHAAAIVRERGFEPGHVDVTLICERPKIGPHRQAMVARVAEIIGLPPDAVSVKATTTEHLGFIGRGEGIAAQAVATVVASPRPPGPEQGKQR